jgi:Cys-tRNA(Pro)/Cys-tRNA(Cys) deacylase
MTLPAIKFLEEHAIAFRHQLFPEDTEKGAANVANALGFRERQMVKTLIFQADTGEKVLVMVGADQNIKSGLLKKAIGSRNIKMADPQVVIDTTGYAIGSIPPFHWQPPGFRSFIDQSLMNEEVLGVGAGVWGNEIIITPADLVKASAAQIVLLVEELTA